MHVREVTPARISSSQSMDPKLPDPITATLQRAIVSGNFPRAVMDSELQFWLSSQHNDKSSVNIDCMSFRHHPSSLGRKPGGAPYMLILSLRPDWKRLLLFRLCDKMGSLSACHTISQGDSPIFLGTGKPNRIIWCRPVRALGAKACRMSVKDIPCDEHVSFNCSKVIGACQWLHTGVWGSLSQRASSNTSLVFDK